MMFGVKKAYCLCLDKREEHWLDLKKQVESKGLEFNRFLVGSGEIFPKEEYSHIDEDNPVVDMWGYGGHQTDADETVTKKKQNHYKAFLSHQAMARKALEDGDEKVLFLEDDAYFTDRFDEVVSKAEEHIGEIEYDMLYLGWWIGDEGDELNEQIEGIWRDTKRIGISRVKRVGGLHGGILSRDILDVITRLDPVDPIDAQFNKYFHHYVKSYFIAPKIIHDKGIYSECELNVVERTKL